MLITFHDCFSIPENPRMMLIGLHTCGDLAPAMLNLYNRLSIAKAIVSVGCCYHKVFHLLLIFNLAY